MILCVSWIGKHHIQHAKGDGTVNKYKKWGLILLSIVGVIVIGIAILVFSFWQSMKGDPDEEEKAIALAEEYVAETFRDQVDVHDALYDNMGNFGDFEYAAKARHGKYKTEFLVYRSIETGEMEDTFIIDKWEDDAEKAIRPSVGKKLGDTIIGEEMNEFIHGDDYEEIQKKLEGKTEINVFFDEEEVRALKIDPNKPKSYTEFTLSPIIRLMIPREKEATDEAAFEEMIESWKSSDAIKQGTLIVAYIKDGVPLEEEEWSRDF